MEMVQEIHQLLMDREDTCHRTCFSLQLNGTTLDNFAELKNIEGLKEGSVIKVKEIGGKKPMKLNHCLIVCLNFRLWRNHTPCARPGFIYVMSGISSNPSIRLTPTTD